MLYDSPNCSNSYYWENLKLISGLLIIFAFLIAIIYSVFLIFKFREKNNKKLSIVPITLASCLYLGGVVLLATKSVNPIYGIFLVCAGVFYLTFLRSNLAYILLSYIVCHLTEFPINTIFAYLNLFSSIILGILALKNSGKKKIFKYIVVYIILLVLFLIGIGIGIYISNNIPSGYCWGTK